MLALLWGSLAQRKFGRRGREVEGTPLLREHPGQNLDRGFESLRLRHYICIGGEPRKIAVFRGFVFSGGRFSDRRLWSFAASRSGPSKVPRVAVLPGPPIGPGDRKSTRLNSSH